MSAVRADECDVHVLQLGGGADEQLEALPVSDPAHAEHDGSGLRDARELVQPARRSGVERLRKSVRPHDDVLGGNAGAEILLSLDVRRRDDGGCSGITPRQTVASSARLSWTFRSLGVTCPRNSNTYGIRRTRHHVATPVPSGSRKPKTCTTSGRGARSRCSGSVGVDPHPAEMERRRQVVHGHAVHELDARPRRAGCVEGREARREHLERMAASREPFGEAPHHLDRPAEGMRRPVGRHRHEDAQRPGHGRER